MTATLTSGRRRGRRRGFTLVEAAVTFVVLAILIGMVTWVGTAADRSANEQNLNTQLSRIVVHQSSFAAEWGTFTPLPADLRLPRNDVRLVSGRSSGPDEVSIAVGVDGTLGLAVFDGTNRCLAQRVSAPGQGAQTTVLTLPLTVVCDGVEALPEGEPPAEVRTAKY